MFALVICTALTAGATSVVPPTFAELVNESDYVVRATVVSVTSERQEIQGRLRILTHVTLNVLEVISGTPPQPLVLEMLGGRVGSEEMVVQGMPQFSPGQEDILFVRGNGRQFYPLTAAMHGRYPVRRDKTGRASMARSNLEPLTRTTEVSAPMSEGTSGESGAVAGAARAAMSPEIFVQQIRAAIDPHYQRASTRK